MTTREMSITIGHDNDIARNHTVGDKIAITITGTISGIQAGRIWNGDDSPALLDGTRVVHVEVDTAKIA